VKCKIEQNVQDSRRRLWQDICHPDLAELEALAIQLEIQGEQLAEWREARHKIYEKNKRLALSLVKIIFSASQYPSGLHG
jgi:hypothetical protein